MTKDLTTDMIAIAGGKKLGYSKKGLLDVTAEALKAGSSLDERAIDRIVKGNTTPHAQTRILILPISAEILGLSREAVAREMYWRDTYDRLSAEIAKGKTPIALEGFLLHLLEIVDASDAAGAWNYAMAAYMFADLQWDAMASKAFAGLLGRSKHEIRQSCVTRFKLAYDRFAAYAAKVRNGAFGLEPGPAALIGARADSMKAVAAEQLFSLALLNEQGAWKLTITDAGPALGARQTANLLPTIEEVNRFSSILLGFLPGDAWIRRINNNKAVLSLAIASAAAEVDPVKAKSDASLKKTCQAAIAALRLPCDGEIVALDGLPTYQSVVGKGLVDQPASPPAGGYGPKGRFAAAIIAGLFFAGSQPALKVSVEPARAVVSQIQVRTVEQPATMRLAGPGGTRPTVVAAIGPGGTVGTTLVV